MKELKTITFQDFSKQGWQDNVFSENNFVNAFYNVNLKNKKITSGRGISVATIPYEDSETSEMGEINVAEQNIEAVDGLIYFRQYFADSNTTQHRILVHSTNKKLYVHQMYSGAGTLIWLYKLEFDEPPICLTYKLNGSDTIILSSPEKMVVWPTNNSPYIVSDVPIITSMSISNKVLFCTIAGEADKIWFSTTLNPELIGTASDYTQYFTLEGERGYARKILTFSENLYVFRDYGITRINYYSARNIDQKQVYLSDSKIFSDTVQVCGDVVMFMTRDGLYSFDGINVKKRVLGIEHMIDKDNYNAKAESLQDKYYLALKLDFDDGKSILCENEEYKNNALLIVDMHDFSYEILRGVDIKNLLPLKTELVEKMLVTFNSDYQKYIGEIDNSSKIFQDDLPKSFCTNQLLPDDLDEIIIRKIIVNASPNITIDFLTDNDKMSFTTYTNGINIFETILPCQNLRLQISSTEQTCNINQIKIKYIEK